jgi:hypothetical protein
MAADRAGAAVWHAGAVRIAVITGTAILCRLAKRRTQQKCRSRHRDQQSEGHRDLPFCWPEHGLMVTGSRLPDQPLTGMAGNGRNEHAG